MKYQLLKIIVCPVCHKRLFLDRSCNVLICYFDNLFFPIRQGIPVLLTQEEYDLPLKK